MLSTLYAVEYTYYSVMKNTLDVIMVKSGKPLCFRPQDDTARLLMKQQARRKGVTLSVILNDIIRETLGGSVGKKETLLRTV